MRLLILLAIIAVVLLVVWALRRRALASKFPSETRYRVVETMSGGEALVHIADGTGASRALIGSVPIAADDFDARYAELVVQAEDRAAMLNASRELRAEP